MKIWQRIFLAALLVAICFMNLIGTMLIRTQYRQNLEYIRQESDRRLAFLAERLGSEMKYRTAAPQQIQVISCIYEVPFFAMDDLTMKEAVRTVMQQETGYGSCIYLDGGAFANPGYEKPDGTAGQQGFVSDKDRLLYYGAAAYRFYGRDVTIIVQSDATAVKEIYWNQMRELLFLSCFFSVLAAIILMVSVYVFLHPLKTVRQGVHSIARGNYGTRLHAEGHTELTELAGDVNEMAEKIQSNMRRLKETAENRRAFIGNMAHEMKTPLTSILGFADLLSIKPDLTEEERREYSEIIVKEATRLRNLSGKLMELVQMQNGMIELRPVDLEALLKECISVQEMLMKEKNITIVHSLKQVYIYGDHDLLQSLIFNILDNSRKASRQGGTIKLWLEEDAGTVILRIRDFGSGMGKEEVERVKEPFYMVDRSRSRKAGGAGLGLALCAEIAELHHGVFQISSEPGKGCLVTLKFRKGRENGESL